MTPAWWTVVLMAAGGALTWATFVATLLWNFRGKWDQTNNTLEALRDRISELAAHDSRIEQRLDRHLAWHDRPRKGTNAVLLHRPRQRAGQPR